MPPQNLPGEIPSQPAPTFQGSAVTPPTSAGHPFLPLLIVLIVLLVGGSFFFFRFPLFMSQPQGQGTLYLGLAPQGSSATQLYGYNLSTGELLQLPTQTTGANTLEISPDGKLAAFVGWQEGKNSQVYVRNLENGTLYQLSQDSLLYKRLPRWAPDGQHIAFTASTLENPQTLEDWSGYVIDMQGITHRIASGAYPTWLTEDEGIMLRRDGVHLFDFSDKYVVQLIPALSGNAAFNMRLAVSSDKKTLAWSTPDLGVIHLFNITNLYPVTLAKAGSLNSHSFWMEFSPDSKMLVTQEVDWNRLATDPKPRLVQFDLEAGTSKKLLDLSGYNQQAMFLSDWH